MIEGRIHIHRPSPVDEKFYENSNQFFYGDGYGLVKTSCCDRKRWLKETSVTISFFEYYGPSFEFKCHKCDEKPIRYTGKLVNIGGEND